MLNAYQLTYVDLLINKKPMSVSFAMFHMQSTYLLKSTICLGLLYSFFSIPL